MFVGVDPDLHNTAIASYWPNKEYFNIRIISVPTSIKGRNAMIEMCSAVCRELSIHVVGSEETYVAVEGQTFHTTKNARFEDIGLLACISGAAIGAISSRRFGGAPVWCPEPSQWKGNVPKSIHHGRIAKELNFEIEIVGGQSGYGVPTDEKIRKMLPKKSDWKHGMDALGLALWARKQAQKEMK